MVLIGGDTLIRVTSSLSCLFQAGTNNPKVSLFVSDLADLDNINTKEIIPPHGLIHLR